MPNRADVVWILSLAWLASVGAMLPAQAFADIVPPGRKFVDHQLRFERLPEYSDHVFFLGWYTRFGNPDGKWKSRRLADAGEISVHPPEAPPYGAQMKLAAVPTSHTDGSPAHGEPIWFEGMTPGIKLAKVDVEMIRSAPVSDRRSTFWTVYRVTLAGDTLNLERTRHDIPTAAPQLPFAVLTACAIAALAAVALMILVGYRFVQEGRSKTGFRR